MDAPSLPTDPGELIPNEARERLRQVADSGSSGVLVIRCAQRELGTELINGVVRDRPGPGVIVTSPRGWAGGAYPDPLSARPELWFKAFPVDDELGSMAAASAVMRFVLPLLRESETPMVKLPLWLPQRLLKAYNEVPNDPLPTIGVDSWDDLLESALRQPSPKPSGASTQEERERLLLQSLEEGVGIHLVVVTRRAHPALDGTADLVLEAVEGVDALAGRVILKIVEPEGGSWTVPRPDRDPPLARITNPGPARCRCGRELPAGSMVYVVAVRRALVWTLVHNQRFCSAHCVRAFFLESLESLDALATPAGRALVSDLRDSAQELASVFALLIG